MSDSEEEVAFESADEGGEGDGDTSASKKKAAKPASGSKDAAELKEEEPAGIKDPELDDHQTGGENMDPTEECCDAAADATVTIKENDSDTSPPEKTEQPEPAENTQTMGKCEADSQKELVEGTEKLNISEADQPEQKQEGDTDKQQKETKEPEEQYQEMVESKEVKHREDTTPTRKVERQGAKKDTEEDKVSEEKAKILEKLSGAAEKRVCNVLVKKTL